MMRLVIILAVCIQTLALQSALQSEDIARLKAIQAVIQCGDVIESSGIAMSYRDPNVLWTHNDSGDSPRLFAFDTDGRHRGEVKIEGAEHVDWEDIASYDIGGVASLMIGDVGDNRLSRQSVTCYRIVEPQLTDDRAKVVQTWSIRYPEGSRDCEAIAVDGSQQLLVLATKSKGLQAELYGVKLDSDRKYQEATATFLGRFPSHLSPGWTFIRMITASYFQPI
ncbi:MAG: hypothetical protein R3C05_21090 [Pirellulaceae bacterium]